MGGGGRGGEGGSSSPCKLLLLLCLLRHPAVMKYSSAKTEKKKQTTNFQITASYSCITYSSESPPETHSHSLTPVCDVEYSAGIRTGRTICTVHTAYCVGLKIAALAQNFKVVVVYGN